MPKWKKNAKEFEVKVYHSDEKGSQIRIPKPLLGKMGDPKKIKFVVKKNKIEIQPSKGEDQ